eukprot:jgi/Botrbrau1/6733/Bobra.0324s0019.1
MNDVNDMHVVIVSGVSGCGKSTVATLLAEKLQWKFFDADHFHSVENVAKMQQGIPLTDEDRMPWLEALARVLENEVREGHSCVLACSALKQAYRNMLTEPISHYPVQIVLVLLDPPVEELERRTGERYGLGNHFMPPSLLKSQLQTLERDAFAICCSTGTPEEIVNRIQQAIRTSNSSR